MRFRKAELAILVAVIVILVMPMTVKTLLWLSSDDSLLKAALGRFYLVGVTIQEKRPNFSVHAWLNGEFQERASKWIAQTFGLRALFVRTGNQIHYSLFNKSYMNNGNVIIGKEGHLYEPYYISDFCVDDKRLSAVPLEATVRELARYQQALKDRGTAFMFLISPSKAAQYPQYIPDGMCESLAMNRPYHEMIQLFDRYGIHYVDGPALTAKAMKDESIPLFPKGGSHWNYLGAYVTVKRLLEQLQEQNSQLNSHVYIESLIVDQKPDGSDKDLADLLNLLAPPLKYSVPHPVIKAMTNGYRLRKVVIIGTSFNWIPIDIFQNLHTFEHIDFYYYYKLTLNKFPGARDIPLPTMIDQEAIYRDTDLVIIEANESIIAPTHLYEALKDAHRFVYP